MEPRSCTVGLLLRRTFEQIFAIQETLGLIVVGKAGNDSLFLLQTQH